MPKITNYYDVLGVSRDSSAEDIERAWREWRRIPRNHPDSYTDPKAKQRAETAFQDKSAAYLVLHDPKERSKHDDELDRAAGTAGTSSTGAKASGTAAGAAGAAAASSTSASASAKTDPDSEAADWGDGSSGGRNRTGYAKPFKSYNVQNAAKSAWTRYFRLVPMLIAAAVIVVLWVGVLLLEPHAAVPSGSTGPVAVGSAPEATASPNPTPSQAPSPSPTPSATPEPCPGGAPSISITNVSSKHGGSITGTISNLTSNAIEITSIGFYDGMASTNNPPDWTDTLSNMSVSPSSGNPNVIDPGDTVTFTESSGWGAGSPPPNVVATFNYPDTNGQMQSNWSWLDLPADCQQNS